MLMDGHFTLFDFKKADPKEISPNSPLFKIQERIAKFLQTIGTFFDGYECFKYIEAVDKNIFIVSNQFFPLIAIAPFAIGDGHQSEIRRIPVGTDDPAAVEMVGIVFKIALAWREYVELARLCCRGAALFGADRAFERNADVLIRPSAADAHVEAFVFFFV